MSNFKCTCCGIPGKTIQIETLSCPGCGQSTWLNVSKKGYDKWKAGEYIQTALPELSDDDREMLISGMCPSCFDEAFDDSYDETDYYDPWSEEDPDGDN